MRTDVCLVLSRADPDPRRPDPVLLLSFHTSCLTIFLFNLRLKSHAGNQVLCVYMRYKCVSTCSSLELNLLFFDPIFIF